MNKAICNPIDLSYKVQRTTQLGSHALFREAADPSVVRYNGRYLMFASMSGGFWHSDDLVDWTFVATPDLPVYDYAPDVREVDGQVVVCASRRDGVCDFYRTTDPLAGEWERVPGETAFWDPNLFQDDDGRLYLFEGCKPGGPVRGVELDRTTFHSIGKPVDLIRADHDDHGWERVGEDGDTRRHGRPIPLRLAFGKRPFIEGAWVTKHDGRYHLQYAAPATELNMYADGVYVATSPLGPYEYSPASPFSSKPGGFITAAGHGSTFEDEHGNWWHAATMRISVHHGFERRIGIFPAAFGPEGNLECDQTFADLPIRIPQGPAGPRTLTGSWMLLSGGSRVTASGSAPGHAPELAVTEDVRTWWTPATAAAGEWLQAELPAGSSVSAVQVNSIEDVAKPAAAPRDAGQGGALMRRTITVEDVAAPFILEASADGSTWDTLRDALSDGRPHDFTVLDEPREYRFVRVTTGKSPLGVPVSVSGLRVFGTSAVEAPEAARDVLATRVDATTADVTWTATPDAHGYNVRYGTDPESLVHCWQVGPTTRLRLTTLNAGAPYWIAVDAFGPGGVTPGSAVAVGGSAL